MNSSGTLTPSVGNSAANHDFPARAAEEAEQPGVLPPLAQEALRTLWDGKWIVLVVAIATFAVTVVRVLLQSRSYTSYALFVLDAGSTGAPSNLSGIASQFGISVNGAEGWQSPAFYTDLVQTRELMGRVALRSYCDPCGTHPRVRPLTDILGIVGLDSVRRVDSAITMLRPAVGTKVARTGIITLAVTMATPPLAQQVAGSVLDNLSRFNIENRQSQAAAQRRFTEQRLSEIEGELHVAESRLQGFLETNRMATSPELVIQQGRLQQAVELKQQLYLTLARSYEQAKIDEVRDTPTITVIDQLSYPLHPDPRGLVIKGAFSLVYGTVIGMILVLAYATWSARRRV